MAGTYKPSYAWVVAFSAFLAGISTITGMFVYGYTVAYMAEEFGVTVADMAIATSMFGALSSGLGFLAGTLADRFGARSIMGGAIVLLGAFLVIIGFMVTTPTMFIVLYSIAGIFGACLGGAIVPKLISSWFAPNMRAKGMVINTLGGSGCAALLGVLIPIVINNFGWRGCFEILGVVLVVCGIVFIVLCRNSPESVGTTPLGASADYVPEQSVVLTEEEKATKKKASRGAIVEVLKMPITWGFALIGVLWYCYFNGANAFQTAAILQAGYDLTTAGLISSCLMVCIMCSQVIFSTLSDRFASRKAFMGGLCTIAGLLYIGFFFVLGSGSSTAFVILWCCMIGLVSGHAALLQTIMAECYPVHLRGTGPGTIVTFTLIGTFFGPLIAAALVNMNGGYNPTAFAFAGGCLVAAGILIWILLPKTGGKYGDPIAEAEGNNTLKSGIS